MSHIYEIQKTELFLKEKENNKTIIKVTSKL